ncbi:MAG: YggT family protein [Thermodesulfobacteriota bacterium]|nr:YggT family protein [Thermodesulfobacteriota bacterium]
MFIVSNFLVALARVMDIVLTIYMWIIIAQAILSWVSPDPYNPIVRAINNLTQPVLYRIREKIPTVFGGLDFSPIIVLLAIVFLRAFVVNSLFMLAHRL